MRFLCFPYFRIMQIRLSFLFAFFYFATFSAAGKLVSQIEDFPDYETVVHRFYSDYPQPVSLKDGHLLTFARKPSGWFVIVKDLFQVEEQKEYAFWKNGRYKSKSLFGFNNKPKPDAKYSRYQEMDWQLTFYLERMFAIHTFYGYVGWADDVIKYLQVEEPKLNDDDLYSLGRAYSAVSGYLTNHYQEASTLEVNALAKDQNNFSERELEQYLFYHNGALDKFGKLAKRSPTFHDIVGKQQTKFANEFVQGYFDMWMYQNEEIALTMLQPAIYPVEILTNARNYLQNCAPNSILITNGDNDTYPLLYVQSMENYRRDVTVVNNSLLSLAAYIRSLKRGINGREVVFNLPQEIYEKVDIVHMSTDKGDMDKTAFLDWLEIADMSVGQPVCPHSQIFITTTDNGDSIFSPLESTLLYKNHVALLDIYMHNNRPLEFANTTFGEYLFGKHFALKGVVSTLSFGPDNVDLNSFHSFLENLDTRGYGDLDNFPYDKEQDRYIDAIFINQLYTNILMAIDASRNQDDELYGAYFTAKWLELTTLFAVVPSQDKIDYFYNLNKE